MKRQNNDPSRLTVRYTGRCSKCGKKLPKSSQAYYWPKGSRRLCEECGAEDFYPFYPLSQMRKFTTESETLTNF